MKKLVLLLIMVLSFTAYGFEFGFVDGTDYTRSTVSGSVFLSCYGPNGYSSNFQHCRENIMDPVSWSKFYTDSKVVADKLVIVSVQQDGEKVQKSMTFNYLKGQTQKHVNLGVNTVFQKALLDYGNNQIFYYLFFKDRKVEEGRFVATVVRGESRICDTRSYTSHNENDCRYGLSYCSYYFQDENFCRY